MSAYTRMCERKARDDAVYWGLTLRTYNALRRNEYFVSKDGILLPDLRKIKVHVVDVDFQAAKKYISDAKTIGKMVASEIKNWYPTAKTRVADTIIMKWFDL